jgi:Xaa-Pro aminopeptidase
MESCTDSSEIMGMIKTQKEIKFLRRSAKITDSCISIIEKSLQEGITERKLKIRIENNIRRQGATLAFSTIVASGKRSALMHTFKETNSVIKGIGLCDFGASYKGYKTDITVPFVVGQTTNQERKIVEMTMKSYRLAISSIRLNGYCWKLFKNIYDYEKKHGFELKHRLGHGLGKNIHEYPFIVIPGMEKIKRTGKEKKMFDWDKIKNQTFQKNMVFTIEPGVYVKNVGGCRMENDFLMTGKGPKALTHAKLIIIK